MRTTRTLSIAAALGLGMSFIASANVVYNSETTNAWFDAQIATSPELTSRWAPPQLGEADVKGAPNAYYIALDTDLDDPLIYTAEGASADVAVVAAEMTATVNTSAPDLGETPPQAALTVIGTSSATNWVGLVGNGSGEATWVTFPSPVPVAGESYSVRIEFDQRQGETRQIRYLVGGAVLGDGWYPNPKASAGNISNVSFSGSGDIAALAGENITENTLSFTNVTETQGFDFSNGEVRVWAAIQGYENVTAELKLVDFTSGAESPIGEAQSLTGEASWDLSSLTAGGTYGYTIVAKDAGGHEIATQTGTFTAAKWPETIWFGADATGGGDGVVTGGSWDQTKERPAVEGYAYVIEEDALFNVTDQKPGSNHVTRVDTKVTFETLVDVNSLQDVTEEEDALGGFVAAKSDDNPQWMALTKVSDSVQWVALTGDTEPEVNVPYVVRAEVDFISATKRVRFLVSADNGVTFVPLSGETSQWIDLATQEKYSLAAVELKGSGKVAKFEATVANKALAVVGGKEYDSMDEALAAAKESGKAIELLTSATIEPKDQGTYEIAPGAYQYASGGKVSSDPKTIVVTKPGEPPVVRPSTKEMELVMTPEGAQFKDINNLREFLERNGVTAYTGDDANADAITAAMRDVPEGAVNGLELWKDYALGIDKTDPVAPVTVPAGDTDPNRITLAIPKVAAATPSGDYTIAYEVVDKDGKNTPSGNTPDQQEPGTIKIPLGTGTYTIKAVFTPVE